MRTKVNKENIMLISSIVTTDLNKMFGVGPIPNMEAAFNFLKQVFMHSGPTLIFTKHLFLFD